MNILFVIIFFKIYLHSFFLDFYYSEVHNFDALDEYEVNSAFNLEKLVSRQSPFNQGKCAINEKLVVLDILSGCLVDFTGCNNGVTVSFWMFINESSSVEYNSDVNIYRFGSTKLVVKFDEAVKSFAAGYLSWQDGNDDICSFHLNLPLRVWFNLVIVIKPQSNFEVLLNGLPLSTLYEDCIVGTSLDSYQGVELGEENMEICMDEFKIHPGLPLVYHKID